jgi:hypothetical protein
LNGGLSPKADLRRAGGLSLLSEDGLISAAAATAGALPWFRSLLNPHIKREGSGAGDEQGE